MILILLESVSDKDTSLQLETLVVAKNEARDLALARNAQSLLQVEARLYIAKNR